MKFLRLMIDNFGSIGELNIDLADQGLVLITGRNEDTAKADSNGAGKSLILEAFCWCLWGKTIRGLTGDDVVNKAVGKDCRVTVIVEEGDFWYRIVRSRICSDGKPNDLRVFRITKSVFVPYNEWRVVDQTGPSMAITQEFVVDLVGMTFTLFCAMMPGAGKRASEMTDLEVKALLERLLQTEVLGKAHDEVKERLKVVEEELSVRRTHKGMLDRAISECDYRLGELKEKFDGYADKKKEESLSIQKQLGQVLEQMEEKDKIIARAENCAGKREEAKEKLRTITAETDFIKDNFHLIKTSYNSGKEGRDVARGIHHQKQNSLEQRLVALPDGGDCPTCYQTVPEEHVEEVRLLVGEGLQEVASEAEALERREKGAALGYQKACNELQDRLREVEARRNIVDADLMRFKGWQSERTTALALKNQLEGQLTDLSKRQEALIAEQNPFQDLITATCEEAYDKAAEACRVYKEILHQEHKQAVLEYWLDGFSARGVRSFMLEHVTPLLNYSAAKYADLLTDGEMSVTFHTQHRQKSGKIVEKFNIQVDHIHGGESYAAASAGEKSRANLVVAFALGDLAALRANKSVSFRFLDEPFENVDESGTDAIVALLNDQKERFETVFVITHQDHFKQLFPNRLTVVKKNGITALEGEHAKG
jgi:DNA repair exonuclease SbcCD ATPase subunit